MGGRHRHSTSAPSSTGWRRVTGAPPLSPPSLYLSLKMSIVNTPLVADCSGVGGQLSRVNTSRPKTRLRGRATAALGRKALLRTRRKRGREKRKEAKLDPPPVEFAIVHVARSLVRPPVRSLGARRNCTVSPLRRTMSKSNPPSLNSLYRARLKGFRQVW